MTVNCAEALARFPDGRLTTVEGTSPSIALPSEKGQVLVRSAPDSKPLTGAPSEVWYVPLGTSLR